MAKENKIQRSIKQTSANIKKSAWSSAIESLVLMVFGIFLVVWPDVTILVVSNVLGAIFIIGGIYRIINYFVVKGQNDFFNNDLLTGAVFLLVGIAAILIGEDIANIFRIIVGIWMVYESLVRINTSIKMHAVGIKAWTYVLITALALLVVGIFVTFNAGAVMQLIGWMMILAGIIGIIGDTIFIQYVNIITEALTGKTQGTK